MNSPRRQIIPLLEQRAIPAEHREAALRLARVIPDDAAWYRFLDQLLLWLGGLALAFATLFFIAYNWSDLGHFAKFAMVETLLILTLLVHWKQQDPIARLALLIACILLGVLLALYGQTYQTGADPWQLFFTWAMLMLPWALISRFSAIWILWVGLLNLSLILYHQTFQGGIQPWFFSRSDGLPWLLFLLNAGIQFFWQLCTTRWAWLKTGWGLRLVASAAGIPITVLMLQNILDHQSHHSLVTGAWILWLATLYFWYRIKSPDLFMIAGTYLSLIMVIVTFVARQILGDASPFSFLFLAILTIGLATGAAISLKNIHREWQS